MGRSLYTKQKTRRIYVEKKKKSKEKMDEQAP